jgi:hypothetical protein
MRGLLGNWQSYRNDGAARITSNHNSRMEVVMTSRIRIRMGPIEVECEGTEDFLKGEFPKLLEKVSGIYESSGLHIPSEELPPGTDDLTSKPGAVQWSTETIAGKINCSSGRDLVIAASAHLTFVQGMGTFSRQQIRDEMKTAAAYYKKSYSNNLSAYLRRLVADNDLVEAASGQYALSAPTRNRLEKQLAG